MKTPWSVLHHGAPSAEQAQWSCTVLSTVLAVSCACGSACGLCLAKSKCVVLSIVIASCLCGRRLLPLIIEHTIDERSPLIGHTFDSLMAVSPLLLLTSCLNRRWQIQMHAPMDGEAKSFMESALFGR